MFAIVPFTELFYGKDLFIDIFSIIVSLLIFSYAMKYYKINKEQKKYKYIISSFALLAISFVFKILTHFTIYYKTVETKQMGVLTITYQTLKSSQILIFWGLFLYRVLSLLALYLLYAGYTRKQTKSSTLLIIYLLLLVGYLSQSVYYVYHLTSFFLLFLITDRLLHAYSKSRHYKTRLLAYSFGTIMLSQALFIFLNINPIFYILAEIIQLCGYLLLLFTFIKVLRDGKKKRKD
jgi:hypothetical protein